MTTEREPTRADHLRAATAALTEADDRISAARIGAGDDAPELDVANSLLNEVRSKVNSARRREVRVDPVRAAGELEPDDVRELDVLALKAVLENDTEAFAGAGSVPVGDAIAELRRRAAEDAHDSDDAVKVLDINGLARTA